MSKEIHIVGGGVAGLTLGLCLARAGFRPVIYERRKPDSFAGMGFLLAPNGVQALKRTFGALWSHEDFYLTLSTLTLHNIHDDSYTFTPATGMCGVLRPLFIERLEALYQEAGGVLMTDLSLRSAQRSTTGDLERLLFDSPQGEIEREAHMVIGADGARSTLRAQLFPHAKLHTHPVTEYVGLAPIPPSMQGAPLGRLVKHYNPQARQSFGYMRLPRDQYIWYAQMMYSEELPSADGAPRKRFLLDRYQGWPAEVEALLHACPFERTFRWNLSDLDVMPSACQHNTLLIGDAAHASLTLSSQGVSSALEDGLVFTELLSSITDHATLTTERWRQACQQFSDRQTPLWRRRHHEARALLDGFMNGTLTREVPIVLS